jgi:hypothetical protein
MVNCSGGQENASSHFTPGWNKTHFFLICNWTMDTQFVFLGAD